MPMPGKQMVGGELYRYAFQGQEKDPETGKEAFQLRLWDGRIGRWLSTDPYGQYNSPYVGMGNDPINGVDPDGGWKTKLGRWLAWAGSGFQGSRDDFFQNDKGEYGIHFDQTPGIGADVNLAGTFMAFSGSDLAAFNNGFAEPVMTPQSTFGNIWNGLREGPNGFAVDKYGYELDYMPPKGGLGAVGLIGGGPSSYKLGRNLIKSGISRPANSAAHHIVAGNDIRARLARRLLAAEKIGINSAKNGVFLPKSSKFIKVKDAIPHSRIHTNLYYRELTKKLQNAGSGNVGKALEQFKQSILNGTVKY